MKRLLDARLYAFVDVGYVPKQNAVNVAAQLCEGGADIVQLRAKDLPKSEIQLLAIELLPVLSNHGVALVINDHLDLAREIGSEFCHLGQEDFFEPGYTHTSQLLAPGERLQIGLSSHAPEQANRALAAGAAYVAVGPVFATGTKPSARPVTLEYVRWAAAHLTVPWFAIGGITLENLDQVIQAGARRICVVSAILQSGNVRATTAEFKRRLSVI